MHRFFETFINSNPVRRLSLSATLALVLGISGCEESAAPVADATDAADVHGGVDLSPIADIDLSLPETATGDRELRAGQTAWVGHVTDGDTLTIWVGDFAPKAHVIRLLGLAAPECFKESRPTPDGSANVCTSDDEIDGLESYVFMKNFAEDKQVTITCEAGIGQVCPKDTFGRSLAYVNVGGQDASVASAQAGHAFSYVTFYASKRKEICAGVYAARDKKIGMWALGTETYILSRMSADTRSWYTALHDKRCDEALRR